MEECDCRSVIKSIWLASPYLCFDHCPQYQRGFTHTLDHITSFTVMNNLGDSIHGQNHPSVMIPSVFCISFLMTWGIIDPLSQKYLTLVLPVQIHLSHFFVLADWSTSPLLQCSSGGQLLATVHVHLHDVLSQKTSLSRQECLATVQQPRWPFPLCCQLAFFHQPSQTQRAFVTIHESG